jgi:hypothetical protein
MHLYEGIASRDSRCGHLSDALAAYEHYWDNSGTDFTADFAKGYDDDPSIRYDVDNEIKVAQAAAEGIYAKTGDPAFQMTSFGHQAFKYPTTEDWQKTLGQYVIWAGGDVTVIGNTVIMRITVHSEDRYNFNPGAADIKTNAPDNANGRFAQLGWAQGFDTHGEMTRLVTWTIGQRGQASITTPGSR